MGVVHRRVAAARDTTKFVPGYYSPWEEGLFVLKEISISLYIQGSNSAGAQVQML